MRYYQSLFLRRLSVNSFLIYSVFLKIHVFQSSFTSKSWSSITPRSHFFMTHALRPNYFDPFITWTFPLLSFRFHYWSILYLKPNFSISLLEKSLTLIFYMLICQFIQNFLCFFWFTIPSQLFLFDYF